MQSKKAKDPILPFKRGKWLTFGKAMHELLVNKKTVVCKDWEKGLVLAWSTIHGSYSFYTYVNGGYFPNNNYDISEKDQSSKWRIFEKPKPKKPFTFHKAMHELFENGKKVQCEGWENSIYIERIVERSDFVIIFKDTIGGISSLNGKKYDIKKNEYNCKWKIYDPIIN